jgi:thiol:disulfide interchange protein DsbD
MRTSTRLVLTALAFLAVLALPHLSAGGATGAASDLGLGRQLAQGSLLAFGIAFAGGVLTSLTPCVYPLIPITVSIFGARRSGSRTHAMALSGLYVLGIAVTYSTLGASAALTGKAFGTAMQSPWVLALVAGVFVAMAASMFGAFELQLPASWQARLSTVGGAGYAGALAMGLVAGLIAAPCTGPVLAAALAFVATQGSVAYGVGIMFAYALGIGLLFFLISAFSLSLPKSGPWMETVKSVFGVVLLAMALAYLKDLFPALRGFTSPAAAAPWIAAAVAAAGVLLGALSDAGARTGPRLAKAAGVALVVAAAFYAGGVADARARSSVAAEIPWLHDEVEAVRVARQEGKPIVIDFWADWCTACKELDRTAWSDPSVREELKRFVPLKIDATNDSPAVTAAFEKYQVVGMPSVIFIDARGRELPARITGDVPGQEMHRWLTAVDRACAAPAVACIARW